MNPGRLDPGHIDPGRINPGRLASDGNPGDAEPGAVTGAERMSWPVAALLIGALSVLGWVLIGLATWAFWR